jgi:hypothetical protein
MDGISSPRNLNIDLDDLADIFDSNDPLLSYYLDLEDGQIILVTEETRRHLNSIYDEYVDEDQQEIDLQPILDELDLSAWERDELLNAHQVEMRFGERYLRVPSAEARQGYQDMEAFIETVKDPRLKMRLEQSIRKRGAFRNFKDALTAYPAERERWFAFKNARMKERVIAWLADEGIEPTQ